MKPLGAIVVDHLVHDKVIGFLHGDLTDPALTRSDVLVVSAFPNDYTSTPTSLIGALHARGLSVQKLSEDKEYDLRNHFSCWLSKPVPEGLGLPFTRVLCFETPRPVSTAADRVDDIFRALAPFIGHVETPVTSVIMPPVTAGDQGVDVRDVVEPLIRAAQHWMRTSPLHHVTIVERNEGRARILQEEAHRVKQLLVSEQTLRAKDYDVFISYSQKTPEAADFLEKRLVELHSGIRIFRDRTSLLTGKDYRAQLDRAIRSCRRFVPLLNAEYIRSPACQDEFNAAWSIRQRSDPDLFFPLLIDTTESEDSRITHLQYKDCCRVDTSKLEVACRELLAELGLSAVAPPAPIART